MKKFAVYLVSRVKVSIIDAAKVDLPILTCQANAMNILFQPRFR